MPTQLNGNHSKRVLLEGIGSFWLKFFKDIHRLAAYDSALLTRYGMLYKNLLSVLMMRSLGTCPLHELEEWLPVEITSVGRPTPMTLNTGVKAEGIEVLTVPDKIKFTLCPGPLRIKWEALGDYHLVLGKTGEEFKVVREPHTTIARVTSFVNEPVKKGDAGYLTFDTDITDFLMNDEIVPGFVSWEGPQPESLLNEVVFKTFDQAGSLERPDIIETWYPFNINSNIVDIPTITNKLIFPEKILEKDVDYKIYRHLNERKEFVQQYILFKEDLTQDNFFASAIEGSVYKLGVWASEIRRDSKYLQELYGSILKRIRPTSEAYREFLQGVTFMYLNGPEIKAMISGSNIILGLPVCKSDNELVMSVTEEFGEKVVYTDKNRYAFKEDATIIVKEGDYLNSFDTLGTAVQLHDWLTSPGWWEGLTIKQDQVPSLPLEERLMTEGSPAYELFDYILKYHTFFVEAEYGAVLLPENFSELVSTFLEIKPKWTNLYMRITMTIRDIMDILDNLRASIDMTIDEDMFQCHVFGPLQDDSPIDPEFYFKYGGEWKGLKYLVSYGTYGDPLANHKYGVEALNWSELVQYGTPGVTYNGIHHYGQIPDVDLRPKLTYYGDPRAKYQAKHIFRFDGEISFVGTYDFAHENVYLEPVDRLVSNIKFDGSIMLGYQGSDNFDAILETQFQDNLAPEYLQFNGQYVYNGEIRYNNDAGSAEFFEVVLEEL